MPIVKLSQAGPECGGKAHMLAQVAAYTRVPEGFVVCPPIEPEELEQAWQALGQPEVAVRSSALQEDGQEQSHAGQFLTLLQVNSDLPAAVQQVLRVQGGQGGVLVQRQIQAKVSGVLFTQDPLNQVPGARLETHAGAGEALVSGRVQPSLWLFSPASGWRLCQGVAHLESSQLEQLWQQSQTLCQQLGQQLDIEFAWDEQLWILQARPITAQWKARQHLRQQEIDRLSQFPSETRWSREGMPESLPAPLPLSYDLVCQFLSIDGPYGQVYRQLGYQPDPQAQLLTLIAGRLYFNHEAESRLYWPWLGQSQGKLKVRQLSWKIPFQLAGNLFRAARHNLTLQKRFESQGRAFCEQFQEWSQQSLSGLESPQLLQRLELVKGRTFEFAGLSYLSAALEAHRPSRLPPEADPRVLAQLDKEEQLRCMGHRGPLEMELAQPRWREIPKQLHFASRLPQTPSHFPISRREQGRHWLMYGLAEIRRILLELDQRYQLQGQIFWLKWSELASPPPREELQKRQRQRRLLLSLECPPEIFAHDLEAIGRPLASSPSTGLQGQGLSWGSAEGIALVVNAAEQVTNEARDFILVCPTTDPGFVPAMSRAAGLIVETGGSLSHGAIVARELSLPAVSGLPLSCFYNGQKLRIDGHSGRVEFL